MVGDKNTLPLMSQVSGLEGLQGLEDLEDETAKPFAGRTKASKITGRGSQIEDQFSMRFSGNFRPKEDVGREIKSYFQTSTQAQLKSALKKEDKEPSDYESSMQLPPVSKKQGLSMPRTALN